MLRRALPLTTITLAWLLVASPACGPVVPPTPTAAPSATPYSTALPIAADATAAPAATVATSSPALPGFHAAVIVDQQSEPVTLEQAQAVMAEAGSYLAPLAGIGLGMADYVTDDAGGSTSDMVSRYISSHADALPHGIVLFSFGDGGQARLLGGYSYAIAAPDGYNNAFASPVTGRNRIYVAVVHFSHRYAACGYGGSETVQSTTSLDGECRNQPGTPCIEHNGYSMCADAISHLYASSPTRFVASTIVHELLHPFAPGGDSDHYNTPECNSRMGYPAQFFDLQEGQYYNGLCPYVYEEFRKSYQP